MANHRVEATFDSGFTAKAPPHRGSFDGRPTELDLHFYTLQIGVLVLQILRGNPAPNVGKLWDQFAPLRPEEVSIWPPVLAGSPWPPKVLLDEIKFMAYTHRMTTLTKPPLLPAESRFAAPYGSAGLPVAQSSRERTPGPVLPAPETRRP